MKNASTGKPATDNLTDWAQVAALADADIRHNDNSPATSEADWTDAFACHSAAELHAETVRRTRGANKRPAKEHVAIRFDTDVLAAFRATGKGWQTRINAALKDWLKDHSAA